MRVEAEKEMLEEQLSREPDVKWYKMMIDKVSQSQLEAKRIDMPQAVFFLYVFIIHLDEIKK
jgi:hypothetical protein